MFELKGHAALVTGSSKGIGRAIAVALAGLGVDIVVHARTLSADAQYTIAECKKRGVRTGFVAADLASPTDAAVEKVFTEATKHFPNLDLLVNNAGGAEFAEFEDVSLAQFERTHRLNVAFPYFLTQRFAKHWQARNAEGRVVIVGSINGQLAETGISDYDVAKGGVEMMVKTLAVALAPKNIRVNGLAPGMIMTHANAGLNDDPAQVAWVKHHTPNGLIPDADSCAGAAVYLLSDEAYHVHGHMLMVDGGMRAWQHPIRDGWKQ
ncbi:MAG: SDR family NAD(P)-dependent oxidoreductase [Chloroflexi bacterium]|nr:SDR family NAD(P)-dependent oxidoreductase [Chloroflexota bacterium]